MYSTFVYSLVISFSLLGDGGPLKVVTRVDGFIHVMTTRAGGRPAKFLATEALQAACAKAEEEDDDMGVRGRGRAEEEEDDEGEAWSTGAGGVVATAIFFGVLGLGCGVMVRYFSKDETKKKLL